MKYYVGVTDTNWFKYLSSINPEDVNFWQPGGRTVFKAIMAGSPFLFKLKHPLNAIAGIGFFSSHTFLPISMAWEVFKERNGAETFQEFYQNIHGLRERNNKLDQNPIIGCIVLTNPIFFKKSDWISVPSDWSPNIVQGKSYSTTEQAGRELWLKVEHVIEKYTSNKDEEEKMPFLLEEAEPSYKKVLTKVRLGQGAFRVLITDAYSRRCAISGERTLPVLEAAHIKPISESGPYHISNGLLLRSDIHKLFDGGYITITTDFKIEVSGRIKEEFENGREYYRFHGSNLITLPKHKNDIPSRQFIEWHNTVKYKT